LGRDESTKEDLGEKRKQVSYSPETIVIDMKKYLRRQVRFCCGGKNAMPTPTNKTH